MRPRARRATMPGCRASVEEGKEFGLEADIWGIEHFTPRHDDHIEAGWRLVVTENLSNQSFRAISLDGVAQFARCSDSKPGRLSIGGRGEHRHQPPTLFPTVRVDGLVLDTTPDVLVSPEGPIHASVRGVHIGAHPRRRLQRSSETVRRFRPLARRRFSTCCPSFVRIRTRNPWVRLRRRLFG